MYLAEVDKISSSIEEEDIFTVSFLRRNSDGSYSWPDKTDMSNVTRTEVVKLSSPSQTIIAGNSLRVKLLFKASEINAARVHLEVPIANIC